MKETNCIKCEHCTESEEHHNLYICAQSPEDPIVISESDIDKIVDCSHFIPHLA